MYDADRLSTAHRVLSYFSANWRSLKYGFDAVSNVRPGQIVYTSAVDQSLTGLEKFREVPTIIY